jgi:outer membrane receptor protein involved in Fe transport
MGVMVSRMYGDDNNTDQREIPSYTVFDLTSDINLTHNWLVSAGINNLFNREYFSRVRSDGVIWALQRNYYLGAVYKF